MKTYIFGIISYMIGFLNCDKEIINHIKKVLMPDNVLFISKDETKDYLKTKDFANYVYQRQISGTYHDRDLNAAINL